VITLSSEAGSGGVGATMGDSLLFEGVSTLGFYRNWKTGFQFLHLLMDAEGVPSGMGFTEHDKPGQEPNVKALLDHVSEQTGLTWTEETRKVKRVEIEKGE
jgi:hypothetical protein